MLERLTLHNFKAFADLDIVLRPLTLLTGMNGMGKSTVIQALLVLRQSYLQEYMFAGGEAAEQGGYATRLNLNGELVELGSGTDTLFRGASDDEIHFVLQYFGREYEWIYYDLQNTFFLRNEPDFGSFLGDIPLFSVLNFMYLRAERFGPRVVNNMNDYGVSKQHQVGTHGETAAHLIHHLTRELKEPYRVHLGLMHPGTTSDSFHIQLESWMGEISPGVRFDTQPLEGTDFIRLAVGFADGEFYRPTNVGFGISYTLPIVVALLSAQPGALILLENPEAHLHPRGQVAIAELMARAAQAGIQVICETHSDHIMNGIRLAIHGDEDSDFRLDHDKAIFHFFQRTPQGEIEVVSPTVDAEGKFETQTPIHFFDEYRRILRKLI